MKCIYLWISVCYLLYVKGTLGIYHGHSVFRVVPENENELKFIRQIINDNDQKIEMWKEPTGLFQPVDIQTSADQLALILDSLESYGLKHKITIPDIQRLIDDLNYLNEKAKYDSDGDIFSRYYPLHKIYEWMKKTERSCPETLDCKIMPIGKSFEGRTLNVFKISSKSQSKTPKTSIWVDANIHAREWISVPTALYFIQQLIEGNGKDVKITSYLKDHDWYIIPMVNPDGYVYTWTNDRLWRKTRSRNDTSNCIGVDANRNFGFKWMTIGASNDPCSNTFGGWSPFSEPESKAVADFILHHNQPWVLYLSLHSYSQLWMAPWGYTKQKPYNYRNLIEGGQSAVTALQSLYGTQYQTGSASSILYESSGTSRDWAEGVANIEYVYTVELRDTGEYGFVLPPDQIKPTIKETWTGLQALLDYIHSH